MNATRIQPDDRANRLFKRARLAASVLPLPQRTEVLRRWSIWASKKLFVIVFVDEES